MFSKFADWLADNIWVVPTLTGILLFLIGCRT